MGLADIFDLPGLKLFFFGKKVKIILGCISFSLPPFNNTENPVYK